MAWGKCDQCGQSGELVMTTATGRRLCQKDADVFNGAAMSMLTGGAPMGEIRQAVAVTGWWGRIMKAMGKSKPEEAAS